MDEIGHEVGVCSQCSTRRHVTLVTRQEPECPANCSWICSNCPLPAIAPASRVCVAAWCGAGENVE